MVTRSPAPSPSKNAAPHGLPPTKCEELVKTLMLHASGRILSRQPHGLLMKVRQRLVFIPSAGWVPEGALADALRAAGITPEQFMQMRASVQ